MAKVYKGTGLKVAKLPGMQPALDGAARTVLTTAKGLAARHRETGAFMRSLSAAPVPGEKGVLDRIIFSDDPGAAAIEYGHLQDGDPPQWVPGKFILTRAANGG